MRRFKCDHDKCKRELVSDKERPFPCSACGHGTMTPMKPKAHCSQCGNPIYHNADTRVPSKWHKPDSIEKEGIDVICGNCMKSPAIKISGKYTKDYPDPYLILEPGAIINCGNCKHTCKQSTDTEVLVCSHYEERDDIKIKTSPFKEEQDKRLEKLCDKHSLIEIAGMEVDIRKFRVHEIYFVKKAYEILNTPYVGDLRWRINLVRCLENALKTKFASTRDLKKKVIGFLKRAKKGKVKRDVQTMRELQSIMKTPGQRIEKARKKLRWTQEGLASYLGFKSKGTITNYEKDERYPPEKVFKWLEEIEGFTKKEAQEWAIKKAKKEEQEWSQKDAMVT